jgi:hypothetical protein
MSQYIHDNTEDEISHFTFINAYLVSIGANPVNLDQFRTLPSSTATGAQQIKRLTNLMQLTVDTSWWTRYRSRSKNPDLGDTFLPAIPGLLKGKFPAIPRTDADLTPTHHPSDCQYRRIPFRYRLYSLRHSRRLSGRVKTQSVAPLMVDRHTHPSASTGRGAPPY